MRPTGGPRGALGLALLLLVGGCGGPSQPVEIGAPLPSFDLRARDGSRVDSRLLAGDPFVVAFWATWCRPCLKDIPELNDLVAIDGLKVVAIALDEEGWKAVDPFLERHAFEPTVVLGDEALFRRFGGFTIPYTLTVDSTGTIRAIFKGTLTRAEVLSSLGRGIGSTETSGPEARTAPSQSQ